MLQTRTNERRDAEGIRRFRAVFADVVAFRFRALRVVIEDPIGSVRSYVFHARRKDACVDGFGHRHLAEIFFRVAEFKDRMSRHDTGKFCHDSQRCAAFDFGMSRFNHQFRNLFLRLAFGFGDCFRRVRTSKISAISTGRHDARNHRNK